MKERKVVRLPAGTNLKKMSWQTIMDVFSDDLDRAEGRVREISGDPISARGGKGPLSAEQKEGGKKGARLAKKLALARLLLTSRMKHMSERGESDARFLVDLVRLLERNDQLLGAYEKELDVWHEFLYVLVEKMKSEKLIVYGKAETGKEDFEKAKEEFRDPHGLV